MRPIDFPEANRQYGKPKSMTDEQCMPLSAYEHRDEDGNIVYINTVWQPSYEDIKAVNEGRPIVLSLHCNGLPPHSMFTYDEEGKINE